MSRSSAYRDGWLAQKEGVDVDLNPYNETTQSYSNREWVGGWCERFNAVKNYKPEEVLTMDFSISFGED